MGEVKSIGQLLKNIRVQAASIKQNESLHKWPRPFILRFQLVKMSYVRPKAFPLVTHVDSPFKISSYSLLYWLLIDLVFYQAQQVYGSSLTLLEPDMAIVCDYVIMFADETPNVPDVISICLTTSYPLVFICGVLQLSSDLVIVSTIRMSCTLCAWPFSYGFW